jgi:hypothetical protein
MILYIGRAKEITPSNNILFSSHLVDLEDDKKYLLPDIQTYLNHNNASIIGFVGSFTSYIENENNIEPLGDLTIMVNDLFENRDPDKPKLENIKYVSKNLFLYLIPQWKNNAQVFINKIKNKLNQNEDLKNNNNLIKFYNDKLKELSILDIIENRLDQYIDEAIIKDIIE